MSLFVSTNVSSLSARRQLVTTNDSLGAAFELLLPGLFADLGAIQNRLQSTIRNLRYISENVSAARSRIRDTVFATKTASLTRFKIFYTTKHNSNVPGKPKSSGSIVINRVGNERPPLA